MTDFCECGGLLLSTRRNGRGVLRCNSCKEIKPFSGDSQRTYKKFLAEKGIDKLFYVTDISNVPSILNSGIFSRNEIKRNNINFRDISFSSVQNVRRKNMRKNHKMDVHDFACLFLTPHTPMLRHVCFHQHKDHEVVLLQLDPSLMDNSDKVYFTDKSCTKNDFNLYNKIIYLDQLNWNYLTKDYDFLISGMDSKEKDKFKGCRGAEILIYEKINTSYIIPTIIAKSQKAKSTLSTLLNETKFKNVQINIDNYKFPLRHGSNAYINKMRKYR